MAFGQAINATVTGTTVTSAGITTVSGQSIAIGIAINAPQTLASVTDSYGNAWIAGPTALDATNNTNVYGYYAQNIVGGAGHTITVAVTGGSSSFGFIAFTYTGRAPMGSLDQSGTFQSASYLQSFPGATTPNPTGFPGDDVFAFNCSAGATTANTFTAGSGFTIPTNGKNLGTGSSYRPMMAEYQSGVSIGTYSGSFTQGNFTTCAGIIMTLAPVSSGSLPQQMMMGMG